MPHQPNFKFQYHVYMPINSIASLPPLSGNLSTCPSPPCRNMQLRPEDTSSQTRGYQITPLPSPSTRKPYGTPASWIPTPAQSPAALSSSVPSHVRQKDMCYNTNPSSYMVETPRSPTGQGFSEEKERNYIVNLATCSQDKFPCLF